MSLESDLTGRSGGVCELCGMKNARTACDVPPEADGSAEMAVLLCRPGPLWPSLSTRFSG